MEKSKIFFLQRTVGKNHFFVTKSYIPRLAKDIINFFFLMKMTICRIWENYTRYGTLYPNLKKIA